MTLPELVVDCENCVQPGQLGVAVGRAVSFEGLKVVNFKKKTYAESILHMCIIFMEAFQLELSKMI